MRRSPTKAGPAAVGDADVQDEDARRTAAERHPRRIAIKQRLREWGRWRRASWHVGPRRVRSWWGSTILDRFLPPGQRDSELVVDEESAHTTDELVEGLDPTLRLVLLQQYVLGSHVGKEEKARACGLSGYRRYYELLKRAHDAFEIRAAVLEAGVSGRT